VNVHAEAGSQGPGVGHAGGGEEVVVVGAEGVRLLQVAGVETQAEQQPEGVGVVVEGRTVVVAFGSPI